MSLAVQIVDAILAHAAAEVSGIVTRNAITAGFVPESSISGFPWIQGYGVSVTAEPSEDGQHAQEWEAQFEMLFPPDSGDTAWTALEGLRNRIHADYSLGGLVDRASVTAYGVDEVSSRDRTMVPFVVTSGIFE